MRRVAMMLAAGMALACGTTGCQPERTVQTEPVKPRVIRPASEETTKPGAAYAPSDAPSTAKVKTIEWPGCVSIYTPGAGWPADAKQAEVWLKAVVDADFGAYYTNMQSFDAVKKAGLQVLIGGWLFEFEKMGPEMRNDPAVLGYLMSDRQPPRFFPTWGNWEKMMYEKDPVHPAVFGMYALWGAVPQFVDIVRPRSMDFYQYHWEAGRGGFAYFNTLETYRRESIRAGRIPVIQYVRVEVDDVRKMRQTTYTSLAYGLRGFKWFVGWLFFDIKKDAAGTWTAKRTPSGEEVAKLNRAIKSYSPIYAKAASVDVWHTLPLPAGTNAAPKDYWAQLGGQEICVGFFQDKEKIDYLLVDNRDAFKPHEATITFNEKVKSISRMVKETGKWEPVKIGKAADGSQTLTWTIEDGSGELFMVERVAKKDAFAPKPATK